MNRRGFLGALAAGLALDPERAMWVPGKKTISIPKPRVVRPILCVGDVVTFGRDPQRYIVMHPGDPRSCAGARFAMISGGCLPWPMLPALDEKLRPTANHRRMWEEWHAAGRPFGARW